MRGNNSNRHSASLIPNHICTTLGPWQQLRESPFYFCALIRIMMFPSLEFETAYGLAHHRLRSKFKAQHARAVETIELNI